MKMMGLRKSPTVLAVEAAVDRAMHPVFDDDLCRDAVRLIEAAHIGEDITAQEAAVYCEQLYRARMVYSLSDNEFNYPAN